MSMLSVGITAPVARSSTEMLKFYGDTEAPWRH
jgi:hypothetical protein